MRHKWSETDDSALRAAVEGCLPLRDVLADSPRQIWWAAVVGRLGLSDVSPDAARSRWDRLTQNDRETERQRQVLEAAAQAVADVPEWLYTDESGRLRCSDCGCPAEAIADGGHGHGCPHEVLDGWEHTARLVEEYEETVAERTLDTVTETGARLLGLEREVGRHTRMLVALCRAWDVMPSLWGEMDP